uniref:C2 NT-type domain-containing protein n=2 Tax=Ciona savignyi TaxID=51511 RepID=H2Y4W9_CIOSA
MSFLKPRTMTKKRFKFQVSLLVDELNLVPFVTEVLYCKVRLRSGGTYVDTTAREKVKDHCVSWRSKFQYSCKMVADPSTGMLDPCMVRISVRKELRGGRSAAKVGFVDLNLAEFAGSQHASRHCLLEGYDDKNRLDNSILKVVVGMHLTSGDPCFKTPTARDTNRLNIPDVQAESEVSRLDSDSSGFGSLPRKTPKRKKTELPENFELGHSRNASSTSQHSKRSDYSSLHSRTPSNISQASYSLDSVTEHDSGKSPHRVPSTPGRMGPPPRPPPPHASKLDMPQNRMGETRVDADDVVNKLMESHDFTQNSSTGDGDNLQLYVASDGSTALGGQTLHNRVGSGVFHPVVFESE